MANLTALLEEEASAEIQAILSEANARASEIVAQAKEEAEGHLAQRRRVLEGQHQAALVRARSSAQLEAASMKLRAQHEAVEQVFSRAEERISALIKDPTKYSTVLLRLLSEAMDALGPGLEAAHITVNPEDRDLVEAAVKKLKLGAEVRSDESVRGGVRVRAKTGNIVVENSLPNRLERVREELAAPVARVLVGEK